MIRKVNVNEIYKSSQLNEKVNQRIESKQSRVIYKSIVFQAIESVGAPGGLSKLPLNGHKIRFTQGSRSRTFCSLRRAVDTSSQRGRLRWMSTLHERAHVSKQGFCGCEIRLRFNRDHLAFT